jgi:hypothetical protein
MPGLADQDLRQQADQRQVGRADSRGPVEQIVEVAFGRLARTDARDEAAMRLELSAVSSELNCTEV